MTITEDQNILMKLTILEMDIGKTGNSKTDMVIQQLVWWLATWNIGGAEVMEVDEWV